MAQRITVTIPDDLYGDLQMFKDGFNISKTCQNALAKEIHMKKIANSEDMITYLKQSKEEFIMNNREIGKEIALDYVNDKILDYESFILIENLYNETLVPQDYSNCYDELKDVLYKNQDAIWDQLEESFQEQASGKTMASYNAIARGFVDGVMSIWAEIKDKIK